MKLLLNLCSRLNKIRLAIQYYLLVENCYFLTVIGILLTSENKSSISQMLRTTRIRFTWEFINKKWLEMALVFVWISHTGSVWLGFGRIRLFIRIVTNSVPLDHCEPLFVEMRVNTIVTLHTYMYLAAYSLKRVHEMSFNVDIRSYNTRNKYN